MKILSQTSLPPAPAAHIALAACFALLPLLFYLAPLTAAAALPVCALIALVGGYPFLRRYPSRQYPSGQYPLLTPLHGLVLIFLVWMAASGLWALNGRAAVILALRLWGIAACTIALVGCFARFPLPTLLVIIQFFGTGMAVAAFIVAADLILGTPLSIALHRLKDPAFGGYQYSRGGVFNAALTLAVAITLWWSGARKIALLTVVGSLAAIALGTQFSAKLALLLGLAGLVIIWLLPIARWLLPVAVIVAFGTAPLVFPYTLSHGEACWLGAHKPSALHRIYIWNFVSSAIDEKPVAGWGLDASRRLPGGQTRVPIRDCALPADRPLFRGELLPLHPHNGVLQIWLELGGVGAILVTASLVLLLMKALRLDQPRPAPPERMAAAIAASFATACLSISAFSFGIWQEWWLSCLGLGAGLVTACCRIALEGPGTREASGGVIIPKPE